LTLGKLLSGVTAMLLRKLTMKDTINVNSRAKLPANACDPT